MSGRCILLTVLAAIAGALTLAADSTWVPHGPGPNTEGQVENIARGEVVGAIQAVAAHPSNANIVYVGAVNGGIWRTDNAMHDRPHWTAQTDGIGSLSIGALAFDPTDASGKTLWAGIGRFSSYAFEGGDRSGLLHSTDGTNWTVVDGGGRLLGLNVSGIAPRDDVVVISVNESDRAGREGIWRGTRGGRRWKRVSGARGSGLPDGESFDLAADPRNRSRLFANAGGGLYRSDDIGKTWDLVGTAELRRSISCATNVAIAVGMHDNVFVAVVAGRRLSALFRSGDGGRSWAPLDLPETIERGPHGTKILGIHPGGQGKTNLSLAADPVNPDVAYVGGDVQLGMEFNSCFLPAYQPNSLGARDYSGRLFRVDASKPSGRQAASLTHRGTRSNSAPHADSRDMVVAPNGVLIEADDGGLYRRKSPLDDTGDWASMNGDIQVTEFHSVAWDSSSDRLIGGAQDTGTPQQGRPADPNWISVTKADGGVVAVADAGGTDVSIRYSSMQYLACARRMTYRNGTLVSGVLLRLDSYPPASFDPLFYTPIVLNNVDSDRLILGAKNGVYESFDQGDTVRRISHVRVNEHGGPAIAYGAKGNAEILYVASGNGVWVRQSTDLKQSTAYGGTDFVADVAIDLEEPGRAVAVDQEHVFLTKNAGGRWDEVTGDLPRHNAGRIHSVLFLRVPAEAILVGTDRGVFAAKGPDFRSWGRLGAGLPTAPVLDLDYDARDRVVVAGTLGRGAWTLKEFTP